MKLLLIICLALPFLVNAQTGITGTASYAFAENDVIRNIDLDGLEVKKSTFGIISTKSVLYIASANKIIKEHQSYSFTLDKKMIKQLEQKLSNQEYVSETLKLSNGMAWFQALGTQGKVGFQVLANTGN